MLYELRLHRERWIDALKERTKLQVGEPFRIIEIDPLFLMGCGSSLIGGLPMADRAVSQDRQEPQHQADVETTADAESS